MTAKILLNERRCFENVYFSPTKWATPGRVSRESITTYLLKKMVGIPLTNKLKIFCGNTQLRLTIAINIFQRGEIKEQWRKRWSFDSGPLHKAWRGCNVRSLSAIRATFQMNPCTFRRAKDLHTCLWGKGTGLRGFARPWKKDGTEKLPSKAYGPISSIGEE